MKNLGVFWGLFMMSATIVSCSQNEDFNEAKKEKPTRVVFESSNEFMNTYLNLGEKGYEFQDEWISTKGINSLLENLDNCVDSEMLSMPRSFQALFNNDMEVQVRDTVIKYENGNLYATNINGIEQNPRIFYGTTEISVYNSTEKNETLTRAHTFTFDWYGLGGSRQHEFAHPYKNGTLKYVNEFISSQVVIQGQYSRALILILKLEWKGRNGWEEAGAEPRDIRIALTGTTNTNGITKPLNYSLNVPMVQRNREWIITHTPVGSVTAGQWNVQLSGEIEQVLTDEITTKWIDFR